MGQCLPIACLFSYKLCQGPTKSVVKDGQLFFIWEKRRGGGWAVRQLLKHRAGVAMGKNRNRRKDYRADNKIRIDVKINILKVL